jgi:hypothetical protein
MDYFYQLIDCDCLVEALTQRLDLFVLMNSCIYNIAGMPTAPVILLKSRIVF